MAKLSNPETTKELTDKGNEYKTLIMTHAMHSGYSISYQIKDDADMDGLVSEVREMVA